MMEIKANEHWYVNLELTEAGSKMAGYEPFFLRFYEPEPFLN